MISFQYFLGWRDTLPHPQRTFICSSAHPPQECLPSPLIPCWRSRDHAGLASLRVPRPLAARPAPAGNRLQALPASLASRPRALGPTPAPLAKRFPLRAPTRAGPGPTRSRPGDMTSDGTPPSFPRLVSLCSLGPLWALIQSARSAPGVCLCACTCVSVHVCEGVCKLACYVYACLCLFGQDCVHTHFTCVHVCV